jgi:menaquinone-dependent protoporphyrinogen oxidase
MRILVCVASKRGSTEEIAHRIGTALGNAFRADGQPVVDVRQVREVTDVSNYDAVVIGSAVYMGAWIREAREFVAANSTVLAGKRVWLFSSGPLGKTSRPAVGAAHLAELMRASGAIEHKVFHGRLDPGRLTFWQRIVVRVVGAETGDFRDWAEIASWSGQIAGELQSDVRAAAVPIS